MSKNITLEDIRNSFIEIERKYDVFSLNYKKVYFWKLIRFDLYSSILKSNGIFEEGHPLTLKQKLFRALKLLKYSWLNIVKKREIKKYSTLILTHGRKVFVNKKYQDIYLMDYIKALEKSNEDFLIIDRPDHSGNHLGSNQNNCIYFERLGHLIRETMYPFFSWNYNLNALESDLSKIESDLKQSFKIDIDLRKIIKKKIFRFTFEKKYFDKLLTQVEPEKILLVVSYGKEELIASANERNIPITEVQHGIINDYHMGYFFPYGIEIPYFPDELILFGEYWKKSTVYPNKCELKIGRFSFFNENYSNVFQKKKNQVLFISQGTIGKVMSDIAVNFAQNNNVECLYKLHPSEFNIWKESYHKLYEMYECGKIKVITDELNINELLMNVKYVIGHNSTAIYEALKFNCFVFVLKLEGYQYLNYLINNNYVKLISADFNIDDLLNNDIKKIDKNTIFNSK